MTDVLNALLERRSEPRLCAPAPDAASLEKAFAAAARAPDHALLRPWRYLVIEGDGLGKLAELFVSTAPANAPPKKLDKLRDTPRRAPMVIVGIACHKPHPKVPEVEQTMSAAAGMGYLLLALQSAGYGAMWRTGALAYDERVRRGLGLADHEFITGFLYVGTVSQPKPEVSRPAPADFVRRWP
ncbi:nitroreductase [Marinobacter sp.]|uniref:nitroreductase family protein n=1 Tax=Marinobacter sp. TaxID=50741 RepID=UPI0019C4B5B8|nr:nitroreductase [Marinobacter sp.]MBC7193218.1 nitroreductase [Marinobacter sp.]